MNIKYTLLSDGSSDIALLPIIDWLIYNNLPDVSIHGVWSDLRRFPRKPQNLQEKVLLTLDFYPCDILFIHRDAEREPVERRQEEIKSALDIVSVDIKVPKNVNIIPIRMTESWLLFSESAIRYAAGNGSGRMDLNIPHIRTMENIPDPKDMLYTKLKLATGLNGRRLDKFGVSHAAIRVSNFIDDFSPLRNLSSFLQLEHDLINVLKEM